MAPHVQRSGVGSGRRLIVKLMTFVLVMNVSSVIVMLNYDTFNNIGGAVDEHDHHLLQANVKMKREHGLGAESGGQGVTNQAVDEGVKGPERVAIRNKPGVEEDPVGKEERDKEKIDIKIDVKRGDGEKMEKGMFQGIVMGLAKKMKDKDVNEKKDKVANEKKVVNMDVKSDINTKADVSSDNDIDVNNIQSDVGKKKKDVGSDCEGADCPEGLDNDGGKAKVDDAGAVPPVKEVPDPNKVEDGEDAADVDGGKHGDKDKQFDGGQEDVQNALGDEKAFEKKNGKDDVKKEKYDGGQDEIKKALNNDEMFEEKKDDEPKEQFDGGEDEMKKAVGDDKVFDKKKKLKFDGGEDEMNKDLGGDDVFDKKQGKINKMVQDDADDKEKEKFDGGEDEMNKDDGADDELDKKKGIINQKVKHADDKEQFHGLEDDVKYDDDKKDDDNNLGEKKELVKREVKGGKEKQQFDSGLDELQDKMQDKDVFAKNMEEQKYDKENVPEAGKALHMEEGKALHMEEGKPLHMGEDDSLKDEHPGVEKMAVEKVGVARTSWPPGADLDIVKREVNGPGEHGKAFLVDKDKLSPEDMQKYKKGWKNNAFNNFASDQISLHRSLPVIPDQELCEADAKEFHKDLPDTSVIICFHNEAWSVLLRTVHAVLDRSPRHLLKEIILVDDASDMDFLGKPLDDYLRKIPIVRVVRAGKRQGLIRGRLLGLHNSTGQTVTYLDSHVEPADGWLEPLLDRVAENYRQVAVPIIDRISQDDFSFGFGEVWIGGFSWKLTYTWHKIPEREMKRRKNKISPIRTPAMAGGLFTISRKFFEEIGTYDVGMDIWGGENIEISMRIWMCGGTLEIVPCSRIGHIFRMKSPYKWGKGKTLGEIVMKNNIRLAEVWMDKYKNLFYKQMGINGKIPEYGDVSERKALRQHLQCHTFQWYLDNVYPEMYKPQDAMWGGAIQNSAVPVKCLEAVSDQLHTTQMVRVSKCHFNGGEQLWMMNKAADHNEVRRGDGCFDVAPGSNHVQMWTCGITKNQAWVYTTEKLLFHVASGRCLELAWGDATAILTTCNPGAKRQQWIWWDSLKEIMKEVFGDEKIPGMEKKKIEGKAEKEEPKEEKVEEKDQEQEGGVEEEKKEENEDEKAGDENVAR